MSWERTPEPPFPRQQLDKPGLESELKPRPRYQAPEYRESGKLEDRVALITGGDSGIGRGVAVLFAREGANVAIAYRPEEEDDAKETAEAIEAAGRDVLRLPGDVRDEAYCRRAVDRVVEVFGRLDILVNNAAYQQHREGIEDLDVDQWDLTFKTNVYGYFYMAKAAVPHMEEGGAVINSGSIAGMRGSGRMLDYAATKGAVHAFTKSLAQDLVARGIRVNCVSPGPVWTPLNPADRAPGEVSEFGAATPYGRPAQPEEIAPAYVFFASGADSSYVTGEVLTLLGGSTRAG